MGLMTSSLTHNKLGPTAGSTSVLEIQVVESLLVRQGETVHRVGFLHQLLVELAGHLTEHGSDGVGRRGGGGGISMIPRWRR